MVVASVLVAVLLAAENGEAEKTADAPARGSIEGPWALVDLSFFGSGTFSPVERTVGLGGEFTLNGGFGFRVGDTRFSPTARFAVGPRQYFTPGLDRLPFSVGWTPLALALAAPDLLNDTQVTGLRLTPVVGLTVPTTPGAFEGTMPITTLSVAGQLERRFGPLELAYRLEGSWSPCLKVLSPAAPVISPGILVCPHTWALSNRIFAEGWIGESLSLALGVSWGMRWLVYPAVLPIPSCPSGTACDPGVLALPPSHNLSAQVLITWAFTKRFGTTLELSSSHLPPISPFSGTSTSLMSGSLSLWFRTDAALQRNWLDR